MKKVTTIVSLVLMSSTLFASLSAIAGGSSTKQRSQYVLAFDEMLQITTRNYLNLKPLDQVKIQAQLDNMRKLWMTARFDLMQQQSSLSLGPCASSVEKLIDIQGLEAALPSFKSNENTHLTEFRDQLRNDRIELTTQFSQCYQEITQSAQPAQSSQLNLEDLKKKRDHIIGN